MFYLLPPSLLPLLISLFIGIGITGYGLSSCSPIVAAMGALVIIITICLVFTFN